MSKKNVSALISAAGVIGGFIEKLVKKFHALGGKDEQLHELLVGERSEEFIGKVVELAVNMAVVVSDNFHIVADYTKTLSEMVNAGEYDRVAPDICSHFLAQERERGRVEYDIRLVHYNKPMPSEDVVRDLDKRGLKPVTFPELLLFGATYPEEQRKFQIAAIGATFEYWRRNTHEWIRHVAYLQGDKCSRELDFGSWVGGFDAKCRFAVVCE